MKAWKTSTQLVLLLALAFVLYPPTVYAYLDPGTGSLVVQAMVAAFFAFSLAIKVYWRKIKLFFTALFSTAPEDQDP